MATHIEQADFAVSLSRLWEMVWPIAQWTSPIVHGDAPGAAGLVDTAEYCQAAMPTTDDRECRLTAATMPEGMSHSDTKGRKQ
jgi:hypothetical protein